MNYLEFEKPLAEIEGKAEELRALARANPGMDVTKEAEALDRYFALRPDVDRAAFMADYSGLAALNEARIIGIFARIFAFTRGLLPAQHALSRAFGFFTLMSGLAMLLATSPAL